MASGTPERPVVLRRLGILKDELDTTFVQPPASGMEAEEGLESFGTETRSSERRPAGARVAHALAFANRNPRLAVVLLAAVTLVGGVLLINAAFGSGVPSGGASTAAPPASEDAVATGEASSGTGSKTAAAAAAHPAGPRVAPTSGWSPEADVADPLAPAAPEASAITDPEVLANVPPASAVETTAPDASPLPLAVVDKRIYSSDDPDVVPPRTSEALPGPTISQWTTRTNAMELIVSETGAVEHVQLLTIPQRMPDILVLSRAKVWKFTPAMKDGRPVRYRLRVTWEVNP